MGTFHIQATGNDQGARCYELDGAFGTVKLTP